uniref:BLUF domain-containing protein n=1 Tax=Phenylobacterium glaciei TaxID=2803784 RepID=A0A974P675_9CAUL|nr:BLUF domain-containing protein [Phenylobacterium glaciei]
MHSLSEYGAACAHPSELDAILAASHRNNRRCGVTGMLCHYEGSFLQFLEGEAAMSTRPTRASPPIRATQASSPSTARTSTSACSTNGQWP